MKDIAPAVEKELLLEELTSDKFLRKTNYGGNELYIITAKDSPNIMREVGRLREISFRTAGGGTGKELDIDSFDNSEKPYRQLIVWDPDHQEIMGGYRFIDCGALPPGDEGLNYLATGSLFHFSENFMDNYFPFMVELGRSFVQPEYQSTGKRRKGIYALDNLWDGLGAISRNLEHSQYFFGKVTMYTDYNREARNLLLYFLNKNFGDRNKLVWPKKPLEMEFDVDKFEQILATNDYKQNYKLLSQHIRSLGETIPPLINSYINLSPTLKVFGTVINDHFGDVEETAIMVTVRDLYESKSERYLKSFNPDEQGYRFEKFELS
jgi:hypothetical protein